MEIIDKNCPNGPTKERGKTIIVNEIEYSYSISKSEKNDSLIIKLFESKPKTNIYFLYEAPIDKLIKDIKVLSLCESIEEMVESLNEVFNLGNATVVEKDCKYYLELKFGGIGISKKNVIELIKFEPKSPEAALEDRIKALEDNYNILLEKNKNLDIKGMIRDVLQEEKIKMNLFKEMEQMFLSKYNLVTKENEKKQDIIEIEKIVNNEMKKKEEILIEKIKQEKMQIIENINEIKNIKQELIKNEAKKGDILNNNNFILLKITINNDNINEKIRFLNQERTYKYFYNFERDDIEVIIDDQISPIKCENRNGEFNSKKDSTNNCFKSKRLEYNLLTKYYFYWTFEKAGIHIIKIIFKKKLSRCNNLFSGCNQISEIDCSNFDCSQIVDCSGMFEDCSKLIKLNLGNLTFALSSDFRGMFLNCKNLEELNVSCFDTKNSLTFSCMFEGCSKLKEINVSKFKSSKCQDISNMFYNCNSITSIDMINWNMKSINTHLSDLFNGCISLKNIKMSSNFSNLIEFSEDIFEGLPKGGTFIWKKGVNCDELLSLLPVSWNRLQE